MARWRRRVRGAAALPEAIAALSRALPAAPNPETFRRAKFDRPEAAAALWSLLARVLSALPAPAVPASLGPEARWVKASLRAQGYQRRALWQLPEDGSQGSRELLLALSWLLARGPLLEQLLAQTRVQLGDRMPAFQCELPARPGPAAPSLAPEGPLDVRLVQWLMGTLRLRWRGLMCSQQEHAALLSKIHMFTRGCHSDCSLDHLSVVETEALRDPESGRQLLQALESENTRLEATMHWRDSQLVYWQWLDTVLGVCPAGTPTPASPPACLPRIPKRGVDEWELLERDLQGLQEELREAAEPRRAAWEARVDGQGQGPQWSRSRQTVREAVGQALAALQQSWEEGSSPAQPLGPHRLVRSEDGMPASQGLQAAEVIGLLRSQEACLEALLCQLQEQCRRELARLAEALPGLIWIPAPGP
ncbi:tubulin epsilon and delta complex protein 1 isoform X1 [Ochotona princeps]|uniref:tubulin epsilon and delta complex protein 1 isoform X1 n=1 Tax=Ochotona princeps TaxID=9978 RepID=UPI002715019E|nr:tubulin epsilon and delta complex protein 1 isoform X1 [Ochotona princeps]